VKAKQSANNKPKTEPTLTMKQKVSREALAWFWVGLVFLL